MLAVGLNRAQTFVSLVTSLNRTDVIVYIEAVMCCRRHHGAADDAAAGR